MPGSDIHEGRAVIGTRPGLVVSRRALLRLAAVGLAAPSLVEVLAGCGDNDGGGMPMMGGGMSMPGWMMSDGIMDPAMLADMRVIMDLLTNHSKIRRQVDDIDAGIRSSTTSSDPRIAELIATHVQAMWVRIENKRPIRHGDPLFAEIFEHHAAISITIGQLPDGVRVVETSADPQVQLLIRQHAHRAVSEFVAQGMPRAMQPTPLPDGYHG